MDIFNDFMKQQFPVDAHTGDKTHPNHPDYVEQNEPEVEIEEVISILTDRYTSKIRTEFNENFSSAIRKDVESLFNEIADYDEQILRKLI